MTLTRKEFEDLADIVGTIHETNSECPLHTPDYLENRIIAFCKRHGHNFNEAKFKDRITDMRNILNE